MSKPAFSRKRNGKKVDPYPIGGKEKGKVTQTKGSPGRPRKPIALSDPTEVKHVYNMLRENLFMQDYDAYFDTVSEEDGEEEVSRIHKSYHEPISKGYSRTEREFEEIIAKEAKRLVETKTGASDQEEESYLFQLLREYYFMADFDAFEGSEGSAQEIYDKLILTYKDDIEKSPLEGELDAFLTKEAEKIEREAIKVPTGPQPGRMVTSIVYSNRPDGGVMDKRSAKLFADQIREKDQGKSYVSVERRESRYEKGWVVRVKSK